MRWTQKEIDFLKKNYKSATKKELLNSIKNRTLNSIRLKAKSLGLKKTIHERAESNLSKLLLENNEAYYWVGFLMADGYINHDDNRIKLTLSNKDRAHLESFCRFIECNNLREFYKADKGYVEVVVKDNFIVNKIIEKYTFKPRKTYNPVDYDFLDNLDKNKFYSFLIGFIDADGSIIKDHRREEYRITIKIHSSWEKILKLFSKKTCKDLGVDVDRVIIGKHGYARLVFNNFKILKHLKKKSVELNVPFLKRKWNKIDENRITRNELSEINRDKVKILLSEGLSTSDISKKINLKYKTTWQIIKKIKNE